MSDNFLKIYNGLSIGPRSADPSNPADGDVQFSDGTARAKGLWQYLDGGWEELAAGGGGGGSSLYEGTVVGTGGDETDLSTAISSATAGDRLSLLNETFTEVGLDINKQLSICGQGQDTEIDGDFTISASYVNIERMRFTGNVTITGTNISMNDCWIAAGKTITVPLKHNSIFNIIEEE